MFQRFSSNVGIAIINLPFWDGLHHLFMVVFGGGLLLLYPHYQGSRGGFLDC